MSHAIEMPTRRRLLYYPTFLPPSDGWIRQALLLWDGFATIVPTEHRDEVETPTLTFLQQAGVYEPIGLEEWGEGWRELTRHSRGDEHRLVHNLERELDERLGSPEMQELLDRTPDSDTLPVSVYKLSYGVMEVLRRHRLYRSREYLHWHPIKRPAALLYMSLLARTIADIAQGEALQPCTDSYMAQSLAFESGTEPGIRMVISEGVPSIREDVPFDDILRFRERRVDELRRFRRFLDAGIDRISTAEHPRDAERELQRLLEDINIELSTMHQILDDAGMKGALDSLQTLIPIAVGTAVVLAERGQGGAAIGALVSGGAVWAGQVLLRGREYRNRLRQSPVSYVMAAEWEGLLDRQSTTSDH